jgi:DNA mismatch repair ATPase MutS
VAELATGQSTFMVEMAATANILHHASGRSLLLLNEIGCGTATIAGLSIARAVHYRQVLGRIAADSHGAVRLAPRG